MSVHPAPFGDMKKPQPNWAGALVAVAISTTAGLAGRSGRG